MAGSARQTARSKDEREEEGVEGRGEVKEEEEEEEEEKRNSHRINGRTEGGYI